MKSLLVVAHPDDEVLWFSSILFRDNCDVVCITCGRDEADKAARKKAFSETMDILDIRNFEILHYPDTDARLDIARLRKDLSNFTSELYDRVYTHSPFGDTNEHIHHQDVSYVVNTMFRHVFSTAWNLFPEIVNRLTQPEYHLKKYLLGTIYREEYEHLMKTYEISAIEKFVHLSKESAEIHYLGIADFGDNHEFLGAKYPDFWGFKNSPYEMERHAAIVSFAKESKARRILEYGSCEGTLTEKLSKFAVVDCVERAPTYLALLKQKGYNVIQSPNPAEYDLSIIASFLEYLDKPETFIEGINSSFIVVDVILDSMLDRNIERLLGEYRLINQCIILPRWEQMVHGETKEKMEAYKLGSHCMLFQKKDEHEKHIDDLI